MVGDSIYRVQDKSSNNKMFYDAEGPSLSRKLEDNDVYRVFPPLLFYNTYPIRPHVVRSSTYHKTLRSRYEVDTKKR